VYTSIGTSGLSAPSTIIGVNGVPLAARISAY
jgi:hypothetical protein